MLLSLYRLVLQPAGPVLRWGLRRRLARGKEDAARLPERWGAAVLPRPLGSLVWLHAASVGESLSLLSFIMLLRARHPGLRLMITTGTVTSARLMGARLPQGVLHQFIPVDHPRWVARFLDHWRPDVVIWSESELWPNMLGEIKTRRIPAVLVNARMSPRSFSRWRRFPAAARAVLSAFSLCIGQSAAEAERLRLLGARMAVDGGNIKYAAPPLPDAPEERAMLVSALAGRRAVLWASTHPGEEEIALHLHQRLRAETPEFLTIIAPRHPARGAALAALFASQGLRVVRRSEGGLPDAETDIYLADTLGEMGILYRLPVLVMMGGSFVACGGHNPIEPAQLGTATVCGPFLFNFSAIRDDFLSAGALLQVENAAALPDCIRVWLKSPACYDEIAARALRLTQEKSTVLDRIYGYIAPFLPKGED